MAVFCCAFDIFPDHQVSEASNGIIDLNTREEQRLHHQTTDMQHIAADARKELTKYIVEAENNFLEDTFSVGESRAVLDSCFEEWYGFNIPEVYLETYLSYHT